MKSEAGCTTQTPPVEREAIDEPGTSPKSAFGRWYQKLSPRRKAEKRFSRADSDASKLSGLEGVFCYFDEDGDGKISAAELQNCVRSIGGKLSEQEAMTVVASSDSDGDGLLGLEDFGKLMEASGEEERNKDLRDAFGMYEMEGFGCITPKSLRKMLNRLGESKTIQDCKAMIRPFDLNGDGVLSFEEFRVMMTETAHRNHHICK